MFKYNLNIVDGLYFELQDTPEDKEYLVKFLERKNGETKQLYSVNLKKGHWGKLNKKYLSDFIIEICDGDVVLETISLLNYIRGKKVFITFESKSLGDTLAWVPYCLEFKKQYNCEVVVSTFLNDMFESEYPELTFVGRGVSVYGIVGMFRLGWYWHEDFEPNTLPQTIPLQQAATNILNLPFVEICPRMSFRPDPRPISQKYIAISVNATSGCKTWPHWKELIKYLTKDKGYVVVDVSKEGTNIEGVTPVFDKSTQNLMNLIHHSEFFIGLGSGSSWLAWALKKHVVMICNFSEYGHEFTTNCTRIIDTSVCHGCWNNKNFKFDKGDWNWCPIYKGYDKHFECQRAITPERVIEEIKKAYLM